MRTAGWAAHRSSQRRYCPLFFVGVLLAVIVVAFSPLTVQGTAPPDPPLLVRAVQQANETIRVDVTPAAVVSGVPAATHYAVAIRRVPPGEGGDDARVGFPLAQPIQEIPTKGARDWEAILIGDRAFLAVANYYDGSNYNINSVIYEYSASTNRFEELQSIPTKGAHDWEAILIGDRAFLAVANYHDGSTYNINSVIYEYSASTNRFVELQSIPTKGAHDWESILIGDRAFLAVANYYDGSNYNINSVIYEYSASTNRFEELQSIRQKARMTGKRFLLATVPFSPSPITTMAATTTSTR